MGEHHTGQIASSAAKVYADFFVPALFGQWPDQVLEATGVGAGHQLLDVACGTGVLANAAAKITGPQGAVSGVDINPDMLAMARRQADHIQWYQAPAEQLPFDDHSYDRVICQFGLMFFDDKPRALREMQRVTRPGGRLGVAVWARLDDTPGYAMVKTMLTDLFDAETAASVQAPFSLGDKKELLELFEDAGLPHPEIHTLSGTARFASLDDWLYTEIRGWTLADVIDDADYARLQQAAPDYLSEFVRSDGSVLFELPAHVATCDL